MLDAYLDTLRQGADLSEEAANQCALSIFTGDCPHSELVEVLRLIHHKGESVSEIVGFARVMREKALRVALSKPAFDLCGTGGVGKPRFNVSTSAAFVLAAAGVPVAKHGNRGSKKANGSFDFLEALGVRFDFGAEKIPAVFDQTDLCFLFARNHHPAVRHAAAARQEVGSRTIFNLLGPLSNPAGVRHQVIGTPTAALAQKLAESLRKLGVEKALVIVGYDGLDELSAAGDSALFEVSADGVTQSVFTPESVGITRHEQEWPGADAAENAQLFTDIFSANDSAHPISETICLNAGASFYCFGKTETINDGFALAQEQIKSGAAWAKYVQYKDVASLQ